MSRPKAKRRDKLRDAMHGGFNKKLLIVPLVIMGFVGSTIVILSPPPTSRLSYAANEAVQEHPGLASSNAVPVTVWSGNQTGATTTNVLNLLRQNPDIGSADLFDQSPNSTINNPYGKVGGWGVLVIYVHLSGQNEFPGDYLYVVLQRWSTPSEYPVHMSLSDHELSFYQIVNR